MKKMMLITHQSKLPAFVCCSFFVVRFVSSASVDPHMVWALFCCVCLFFFSLSLVVTSSHFFQHFHFRFRVVFIFSPFELEFSRWFELWLDVWCVFYIHLLLLFFFSSHLSFHPCGIPIVMQSIYWIIIKWYASAYCPRNLRPVQKSNQYAHMNIFIYEVG